MKGKRETEKETENSIKEEKTKGINRNEKQTRVSKE